ncbi:MAG: putative peptidase [Parcubacteria group bacterium Gr01-1014_73]|nr:MAG: putative peptidase [Parcubacteria group bacterium Gr01-1014_73]
MKFLKQNSKRLRLAVNRKAKPFSIFVGFFLLTSLAFAQDISNIVTSRRAELENQLAALQKEIDVQQQILKNKQRESVSLERDIAILNAKIDTAKLSIKVRALVITNLNQEIDGKEKTIAGLSAKIARELASLADLLRKTRELDNFSVAEFVLSGNDLSAFFEDLDNFQTIKASLAQSFEKLRSTKSITEEEKSSLEDKAKEETDLKKIQELEKKRIEEQEKDKKDILKISRGVETVYQKIIKDKEKSAAQIRAELFALRGSAAIPFEKAYEYATRAAQKTGVRAAVILGIIAEESNLGENVGTGNWKVDMKAPRDTVPFLAITAQLGLNPNLMPVSKKPWYGYGGAMGPAQFIPSTWVLYEDRIAGATGHNPPNPWEPEDAFMATGLLMADNGADKQTYNAERLAALRYLAGWKNATKSAYAFYGDDVMELAAKYQQQIDIIKAN